MRQSTTKIKEMFKQLYPKLRDGERVWIFDTWKEIITEDKLRQILEETKVERMKLQDCDDYALQLHAEVNKINQTWAFGEVCGFSNEIFTQVHQRNFCVCEEGLRIVEPTTDEILKPDFKIYDVFFVRG